MKKAIVTGANGFIGSALILELLSNGYQVIALHLPNRNANIPISSCVRQIPFQISEIDNLTNILPVEDYDFFFHLAWAGTSGNSRTNVDLQLQNAKWTIDALKLSKKLNCKRFISAGSIMEHETIAASYTKNNKPGLGYIYGSAKLVSHTMCMSVATDIGADIVWPTITNAYGEGEISPRLINSTIRKCLRGESPSFTSGVQNYDFIYISDVARAFRMIAECGNSFNEYIVGSSSAKPLKEFLLEIKTAIAPNLDFNFGNIPFTGINLPLSVFNCDKTEKDTGFRATTTFSEGCKLTYNWISTNENLQSN